MARLKTIDIVHDRATGQTDQYRSPEWEWRRHVWGNGELLHTCNTTLNGTRLPPSTASLSSRVQLKRRFISLSTVPQSTSLHFIGSPLSCVSPKDGFFSLAFVSTTVLPTIGCRLWWHLNPAEEPWLLGKPSESQRADWTGAFHLAIFVIACKHWEWRIHGKLVLFFLPMHEIQFSTLYFCQPSMFVLLWSTICYVDCKSVYHLPPYVLIQFLL